MPLHAMALRFTRALFGLVSSPFLLGVVIDAHLSNWDEREPEVVAKLRKELYIDDLISGSTSVSKAKEIKEKATSIFEDACFKLHKWHSNERELEATQAQDHRTKLIYIFTFTQCVKRVKGMYK